MACPICKATKKKFSIKVKDYEYDINFTALYSQCRSCESIYRTKPKKVEKEKIYYPKNKYLPLKGNIIYDFFKKKYAEYEKRKIFGYLNNFLCNIVLNNFKHFKRIKIPNKKTNS